MNRGVIMLICVAVTLSCLIPPVWETRATVSFRDFNGFRRFIRRETSLVFRPLIYTRYLGANPLIRGEPIINPDHLGKTQNTARLSEVRVAFSILSLIWVMIGATGMMVDQIIKLLKRAK